MAYKIYYHCCPYWVLKSPAIHEVYEAWHWFKNGQLEMFLDGDPLSFKLKNAIRVFDNGYNIGYAEKLDEEKKKNRR